MTKWKKYRIRREPSWNPWQRPNVEVTHFFNKKHSRNEFVPVRKCHQIIYSWFLYKNIFCVFFYFILNNGEDRWWLRMSLRIKLSVKQRRRAIRREDITRGTSSGLQYLGFRMSCGDVHILFGPMNIFTAEPVRYWDLLFCLAIRFSFTYSSNVWSNYLKLSAF